MARHNVECSKCGKVIYDYTLSPWPEHPVHGEDGGELIILWQDASSPRSAAAHPRDRTVVWQDPITGEVKYPPTNDMAMPSRYKKRGFQRVEFESARDVEKFEKQNNVRCEKLWYNSGNGM